MAKKKPKKSQKKPSKQEESTPAERLLAECLRVCKDKRVRRWLERLRDGDGYQGGKEKGTNE